MFPSHRLFSRLKKNPTVSLTVLLVDKEFFGGLFNYRVPRCKQKTREWLRRVLIVVIVSVVIVSVVIVIVIVVIVSVVIVAILLLMLWLLHDYFVYYYRNCYCGYLLFTFPLC